MAGARDDDDDDVSLSSSQRFLPSTASTEEWDGGLQSLSIKQVLESKPHPNGHLSSSFLFEDLEINLVTLVAAVVQTSDTADSLKLELQDGGEGTVSAYWSFKSMASRNTGLELEGGSYVRIIAKIGRPNRDGGTDGRLIRNYLKIDSLRRVDDPYEIFFHILEVMNSVRRRRTAASRPGEGSENVDTRVGGLVDSAQRLNLSESQKNPFTHPEAPSESQSRDSVFNRNNALGLTDSPLLTERQGVFESNQVAMSSPNQIGQISGPGRSEFGARDAKVPMRTLSSQSTLVDSPASQSPVRTRASSPAQEADPYSHLSNLERAIHLHLLNAKANGSSECHITDITYGVRAFHRTGADILAALDVLEDNGYIRATDEFHFELVGDEESLYDTPSVSPPGSFPF